MYEGINNGVYRCGFATTQAAYEEAFAALASALDRVESVLAQQRYIAAAVLTEADVRLYMTLIRFDAVYAVHFKTNMRLIRERPHTFAYLRELYQMSAFASTTDLYHIKAHYFGSHLTLNPAAIVPVGYEPDMLAPHGRDRSF